MSKHKVIKQKYIPVRLPVTGITVTYLLYKQLNLHGTAKGVFLTLAVLWWAIVLTLVVVGVFTVEPSDPLFKEDL